jgi:hypothetical protein
MARGSKPGAPSCWGSKPGPTEGFEHRLLHEIAGLVEIAGSHRKPAVRPSFQARPIAPNELLSSRHLALLHPREKDEGR